MTFLLLHWQKIAAAIAVVALLWFVYGIGRQHANNAWEAKWAQRELSIAQASQKAIEQTRQIEQQYRERVEGIQAHYEKRIHAGNDALFAALDRVRNNAVRPLAPAAVAPATCRDYEAPPSQLSVSDREILVWLGAAADRTAEQLAACQGLLTELRR